MRTKNKSFSPQYDLNNNKIISFLVFFIGFSMNISQVISGINIALSDIFLMLLFGYLIYKKLFYLNSFIFLYFLFIICFRLFATSLIGIWIPIPISLTSITITIIKFLINLLYLCIFMSIFSLNATMKTFFFNGIMYGTVFLGVLSLIIFFLGPTFLQSIVLFGGLRLRGFMNDPNFFGYMQISGFCIWLFNRYKSKIINLMSIITYVYTIILSASKTSLLIFLLVILAYIIYQFFINKKSSYQFTILIFIMVFLVGVIWFNIEKITSIVTSIVSSTPQLSRTMVLFDNFDAAINAEGSNRANAWHTAINIIKGTNFFGIGFIDYSDVANYMTGMNTIAHNTYLQLAVEWGIYPLVISILIVLWKILVNFINQEWKIIFMTLTTLSFSLSISLQNSRLLWCILAILFLNNKKRLLKKNATM
ncbi:oligosaccharide repeat unit polymerase [Enterococcus faecium]|nr:oligosaccharide repeat unit polymerase [Enterococcus faecium]